MKAVKGIEPSSTIMVKRSFKKFMYTSSKWILLLAAVYCVILSSTAKSPDQSNNSKALPSERYGSTADEDDQPPKDPCPSIVFTETLDNETDWQPVDESKKMYMYAAYHTNNNVYVLGVRPVDNVAVYCQLWNPAAVGMPPRIVAEVEARVLVDDFHGYRFTPTISVCPAKWFTELSHVSLVTTRCEKPISIMKVKNATAILPYKRRLTVCLPPLPIEYDKIALFLYWVEINRLLGVDQFYVYYDKVTDNIEQILKYYLLRGVIEKVEWRPPMAVSGAENGKIIELENYGEVVALNDCLFKNKQFSEFVSTISVTEYIIPLASNDTHPVGVVNNELDKKVPAYAISMAMKNARAGMDAGSETGPAARMVNRISKLLIRTADVHFALPRVVPGIMPYAVPPEKIIMHKQPAAAMNQIYGTAFGNDLPPELMQKVQANVKTVMIESKKV